MIKKYKTDIIVIMILLIVAILITIIISICKKDGRYASISIDGQVVGVYSLEDDADLSFDTGHHVIISDSMISVTDSDCRDKICMNKGKISSIGDTIVCLPEKFIIEIIEKWCIRRHFIGN